MVMMGGDSGAGGHGVQCEHPGQEGRGDMLHCTMGDTCSGTISPLRQPINYYKTNVLIMQLKLCRLDYHSAEASCVNSTLH